VRAVLALNVAPSTSRALAGRLAERHGEATAAGETGLTRLFPRAAALARADLESLGLSATRASTLRALARGVDERRIDFAAPVDDVRRALAALPGGGETIAEHVALRALAEPDALPGADLALRRAAAQGSASLDARRLLARAEAWRPWRGYAAMHLWCE